MKLIDVSTRKFPNTFTMVDDEDFEYLNQWKWCVNSGGYVRRHQRINGKQLMFRMHREILKPPPGMHVDHRFGNTLDNRRENLRVCTISENAMNRKPKHGRTLPKGVCRRPHGRFTAQIELNGLKIHLGYFYTAKDAEAAYVEASKKYHGEFRFQYENGKAVNQC